MGLFKRNKDTSVPTLIDWLNSADDAYSMALQTKSIQPLQPYVDQVCARSIISKIRADEKVYAGLDRYKHVTWSKGSSAHGISTYIKKVNYDHVKLSKGVIAPVGQDYVEEWDVTDGTSPKVTAIRRVS